MNKIFIRTNNQSFKWREDDDGFLRCTTSVLKDCVMNYTQEELEGTNIPDALLGTDIIRLYAPEDELNNEESLKSLEGKPISLSHDWQSKGDVESVGSVAGEPVYRDGYIYSDILINDPKTINRIKGLDSDRLIEQSAAYLMNIDWTPGITESGEPYDGIQRNIKYNHIMLLPYGEGRSGRDIRIINKTKVKGNNMSDYVYMKIGNSKIRVFNEDVEKLEGEMDKKETDKKNTVPASNLEDSMKRVDELNGQMGTLSSERDELLGQLQQLKEQIEELTNVEVQGEKMQQALKDCSDAKGIMNKYGIDEKEDDTSINTLVGNSLKSYVVEKVRAKNSKPKLSDDQLKNKDFINGMFMSLKEVTVNKSVVNGSNIVKLGNKDTVKSPISDAKGRLSIMRQRRKNMVNK